MENPARTGQHDLNLASRKAEEAALRRYEAVSWLESLVGPLGISSQPSEREFISRLRNGLILCNAVNKIQPGAVPKVVESHLPSQSLTWDSQPLPAYQYFENVRNFLVAVEELKLQAFEASDLERDNLEVSSAGKVVDCILALKSYHEWKQQVSRGSGFAKNVRSPLALGSANRGNSRVQLESCRRLDMLALCERHQLGESETQKLEALVVKALLEHKLGGKENIDGNLLLSCPSGNQDAVKLFSTIMLQCLEEQFPEKYSEVKAILSDLLVKGNNTLLRPASLQNISLSGSPKCRRSCFKKGTYAQRVLLQAQEKDLSNLKVLLSRTKRDFEDMQLQLHTDMKILGSQVQELSTAALGYQKVVKENRNLYNMVMDLKGNIRVYCRIRPASSTETKNVIDFVGEDGSLVLLDPSKPQKDGRKVFQFNRVFHSSATQDDVFLDTQPLIRSVMDGYNVCIFAYGQTGSGKTHTMSGPSGGSEKDMGINYLALSDLFQISNGRKDVISYEIRVQMVEIYNEQVRDLLAEDSSATKLEIRSCTAENGVNLPDATMHFVKSTSDVLGLMKLGETNRVVSSTALNNRSSRSHSILTCHVHGKDKSGSIIRSCLHLVDLAGSERVNKSDVTGERLKEAQHINKSLSSLGDVITALAQKSSHVPYRNSKLTLLLQDSLGGHAKTLMFAHISPEGDSFGETISTLKFAQRVSTVEIGAARLNKETSEVLELKEEIESLKKALANKEARSAQVHNTKEPYEKPEQMLVRTPLRPRRLSIENCGNVKIEKPVIFEDKKGPKTPPMPTRSRRLSMEGQRSNKRDPSQEMRKPILVEAVPRQQHDQPLDAEAVYKPHASFCNGTSMIDVHKQMTPRSPKYSARQGQCIKTEDKMIIAPCQLLKTPEKSSSTKDEVQILMQRDLMCKTDSLTPTLISNTSGKGSQIRKSLRTIGKLINGSEKRNQQQWVDRQPEQISYGANDVNSSRSQLTTNSRILRRQSLTGAQTSRRSSLGGKSNDSFVNQPRNAKTPPPVHPSTKTAKRWL